VIGFQNSKSGFCSKKVRISTKRYCQFTISEFSEVLRACGAVVSPAGEDERALFTTICHAERGKLWRNQGLARFAHRLRSFALLIIPQKFQILKIGGGGGIFSLRLIARRART